MDWEFPKFWIKDNRLKMFILLPRNNHILFWIMIIILMIMIFFSSFQVHYARENICSWRIMPKTDYVANAADALC